MTEPLVAELGSLATEVARTVGIEVGRRRTADMAWSTKSSSTDLVTEIDEWAEHEVVRLLSARRPDDGFLGEEGTSSAGTSGVRWIIDPIDGTTNFVYDLPGFSVSVAAEVDGVVVAGAVYDPVRAELFSATRGAGASRNDEPISASGKADLDTALVETGFGYRPDVRADQAQALVEILPAVRDIRRMGGAALALCSVACGRVDAYYETGLNAWDWAAGGLIAEEAGAAVQPGDLTLAAAPGIAADFFALLGVRVPDVATNRA